MVRRHGFRLSSRTRPPIQAAVLFFVLFAAVTFGLTGRAAAYSLVEGYYYTPSEHVKEGMYVSIVNKDQNEVAQTTRQNMSTAIGVVSRPEAGLLTLANDRSNIYVATTGTYAAFVSEVNGPVSPGDQLTASPIAGVLMKAGTDDPYVLGVADGELSSATAGAQEVTYETSSGARNAKVGAILVFIKPLSNPNRQPKNLLFDISERVVRRPVTILQVVFAGLFFIVTLAAVMALMGNAIRTAISAIGRNPLAKHAVLKGLAQVGILSVVILTVGVAGTYIILWI